MEKEWGWWSQVRERLDLNIFSNQIFSITFFVSQRKHPDNINSLFSKEAGHCGAL